MVQKWLLLATMVTGVSVGSSYVVTKDWKQSLSIGLISLASVSIGGVAAPGQRQQPGTSAFTWASESTTSQAVASASPGALIAPTPGLSDQQVAVFWDYENVKLPAPSTSRAPLAESLIDYAKSLGHVRVKIVYSNWRRRDERTVQTLYSLGFEPIHVSMGKANSVDVKLAVDCLETAYREPTIQQFIVVTGDKDFVPLVNALKDLKRQVTIIGRTETVGEELLLSADEFVPLKQLFAKAATQDSGPGSYGMVRGTDETLSYDEAVGCLVEAIGKALEQKKSTQLSTIGKLMRDINPLYQGAASVCQPNGQPFVQFSDLITLAEQEGRIRTQTTAEGLKELFLIEENPSDESEFQLQTAQEMTPEQWRTLIKEVELAFQGLRPVLSFVPLLRFVTRAKTNGTLAFLSHGSLRKALQRLIDVGVLVHQEDRGFSLVADLEARMDEFLSQLVAPATLPTAESADATLAGDVPEAWPEATSEHPT